MLTDLNGDYELDLTGSYEGGGGFIDVIFGVTGCLRGTRDQKEDRDEPI